MTWRPTTCRLTDKIESLDYSISIRASQTRITRCLIRSLGGVRIYSQLPEHRDIIIAYNDFIADRLYRYGDAQLYIGDVTSDRSGPTEIDIAYNRFLDTAKDRRRLPDGSIAPVNGRFAIYLGHSKPGANPTGVNLSIRIHHNAILGHRPHAIYTKRHVYIGFNYAENADLTTVAPQIGVSPRRRPVRGRRNHRRQLCPGQRHQRQRYRGPHPGQPRPVRRHPTALRLGHLGCRARPI